MSFLDNWNAEVGQQNAFGSNTGGGSATSFGRLTADLLNAKFSPGAPGSSPGTSANPTPTPGVGTPIAESGNVTQSVQLSPTGAAEVASAVTMGGSLLTRAVVVILGFIFVAVGLSLFRIPQVIPANSLAGHTVQAIRKRI